MIFFEGCAQVAPVKVGVYFGGGDAFMAHHFLHCTEVCPTLNEVGGE